MEEQIVRVQADLSAAQTAAGAAARESEAAQADDREAKQVLAAASCCQPVYVLAVQVLSADQLALVAPSAELQPHACKHVGTCIASLL